jgi:hypothetical protein
MFHVHSNILKLYSQYFFSFLDAPSSSTPVPGTAFKYDWTTKVFDEGQDWQLVSNNDEVCCFFYRGIWIYKLCE